MRRSRKNPDQNVVSKSLLSVFFLLFALWSQDVFASALITTDELQRWIKADVHGLKILNVVSANADASERSDQGHGAGVIQTDLRRDGWVIDYDGLPGMLPPVEQLLKVAAQFKIHHSDTIVIVPGNDDIWGYASAARVFWTLRVMGHEKLFLLNAKWSAHMDVRTTAQSQSQYALKKLRTRLITNMGGVYAGDDYQTPPLDIRDVDRSEGYTTHPLVYDPGTIYGALNIPPVAFFENGRFKSKAALVALMDDVIGKPPGPVVVFSDTGLRAAIGWFAIHEIMGIKDVRIYDGGYIDWDSQGGETYDERNDMGDALG